MCFEVLKTKPSKHAVQPGSLGQFALPDRCESGTRVLVKATVVSTNNEILLTEPNDNRSCLAAFSLTHITLSPLYEHMKFATRRPTPGTPFIPGTCQLGCTTFPSLFSEKGDYWAEPRYWSGERTLTGVQVQRYRGKDILEAADENGPEIPLSFPPAAGSVLPFFVGCEIIDSNHLMIAWVGVNGSVNVA